MAGFSRHMSGKPHPGDREIAKLAERQHGVVALWQLIALGFEPDAVEARVRRGRLHRLHRGVFAVGHRRLDWRGVLIAAVLAYGPEAVLSHRSAARLWGIRPDNRPRVDVTVPARGLRSRKGIQVHCVRELDARDIGRIDGHVIKALTEAERQQIIDLRALRALMERSPGRRGQRPLREILADAVIEPETREEFEHRFLQFCHEASLPRPKVNTDVEGYEVDALWRHAKLVVELDSWEFHQHRKAFEDDRERDAVLLLTGYRVVRVTWRQLTRDPRKLEDRLKALL